MVRIRLKKQIKGVKQKPKCYLDQDEWKTKVINFTTDSLGHNNKHSISSDLPSVKDNVQKAKTDHSVLDFLILNSVYHQMQTPRTAEQLEQLSKSSDCNH